MERDYFHSKILLFGEYTIITGGEALAIPLKQFQGFWDQSSDKTLQQNLPAFAEFLTNPDFSFLNSKKLKSDLSDGWFFSSNIPAGYGVGSSGALVAGALKKYGEPVFIKKLQLADLKEILAKMERFFHGSSSGTDPLISFLNQPIHLKTDDLIPLDLPLKRKDRLTFFLLDTGLTRKTSPLVQYFTKKMNAPAFAEKIEKELKVFNQQTIKSYLNLSVIKNESEERFYIKQLIDNFNKISHFQFENFGNMIPDSLTKIWSEGLKKNLFNLKLCGAGGGGFMIGLTKNFEQMQESLTPFKIIKINI